jgi:hypothetical protein
MVRIKPKAKATFSGLMLTATEVFMNWGTDIFRRLISGEIRTIMKVHAVLSMILGIGTLILPHRFYINRNMRGQGPMYNHFSHEFIRLYGCLTLGIGWVAWSTRSIKDGRLLRAFTEAFAVCYSLQALVMMRAQFTSPDGHSTFHWVIAVIFACLGSLYAFGRLSKKLKDFELP